MSDDNNTMRLGGDDASLAGDALLHAVRRDMQGLFGLVKALGEKVQTLDEKIEALNAKVEARLRDTTPMWEVVVSRLDTIVAEQESHGRRLDAIGAEQHKQGARLDAIEGRLDAIEGRLDAIEGRLDAIEVKLGRFDAIDTELRLLRRRIERTIGQLSRDVVEYRADQHDIEDRVEKLEKTPA